VSMSVTARIPVTGGLEQAEDLKLASGWPHPMAYDALLEPQSAKVVSP
jgi:hypothetical protein